MWFRGVPRFRFRFRLGSSFGELFLYGILRVVGRMRAIGGARGSRLFLRLVLGRAGSRLPGAALARGRSELYGAASESSLDRSAPMCMLGNLVD